MFLLGSCWIFTAVGAIEGINAIKTGKLISLSAQELLDCNPAACNTGFVNNAFNWVIRNGGLASDYDYAYTAKKGFCRASQVLNWFLPILKSLKNKNTFCIWVRYINFWPPPLFMNRRWETMHLVALIHIIMWSNQNKDYFVQLLSSLLVSVFMHPKTFIIIHT